MLYFNYVANIIKFGICWDDGHVGICGGYVGMRGGICGDMCYMRDGWWVIRDMCYMRDGPPPRNHPGRAAVFGAAPPNPRRAANGNGKQPAIQKKECLFSI